VSEETRTISDLVNAISEEMTRLDYKPTVLKQYHIVWNKLCKRAGARPANDFDMEFGMEFLDEAMRAHAKHLNANSKHRWIKADLHARRFQADWHPFSAAGETRICFFRSGQIRVPAIHGASIGHWTIRSAHTRHMPLSGAFLEILGETMLGEHCRA
jgi:hypothetical protein